MRWAVAMRTKNPSLEAFTKAYNEGRIVRIHLLRGTWQLVAGEDYRWMHGLCSDKAERVIRGWMSANKIVIPEDEQMRIRDIIVDLAEKKGSFVKEDVEEALSERGLSMDDHRLSYHLRFCELRGVLCCGDLMPMKASYSLVAKKVPASRELDREESLGLLARKYFQSHSPATFEDYVWWSGMGVGDCRLGLQLLGDELQSFKAGGREFFFLESCRTRGFRKGEAILLPSYDELLIGYKSRDISLPPEFAYRAHNNSGNFSPIVLHDGIVCGNWSPFSRELSVDYFTPDTTPLNESDSWAKYIEFR